MKKKIFIKAISTMVAVFITLISIPFSVSATGATMYEESDVFIKTYTSSECVQIDTNGLGNVTVGDVNWNNIYTQRWKLVEVTPNYYAIQSQYNQNFLTVPTNATNGTPIIFNSFDSSNYACQEWKFILQPNGGYIIQPRSHEEDMELYLAVDGYEVIVSTTATVWDVEVFLLPTSGSEISYNPSAWAGDAWRCNCYGYALNNQIAVTKGEKIVWEMQQPGQFSNLYNKTSYYITLNDLTANPTYFLNAVEADFNAYSSYANQTHIFEPIGEFEECPTGTYKVALVMDEYNDYHWYRQDADGYWSHKRAQNPVSDKDASGKDIVNPASANRSHGQSSGFSTNYDIFIVFFAVTPWNNYLNGSADGSFEYYSGLTLFPSIAQIETHTPVTMQSLSQLSVGMTREQIVTITGSRGTLVGSGMHIYEYTTFDNQKIRIHFSPNENGQLIATKIITEGNELS